MIDPKLPPQSAAPVDAGSRLFNKLWYLFFEGLTLALRGLLKLVNSGTHADRLAAKPSTFPTGALWFETDRGGVEYQVRLIAKNPTWIYVAGEMRGATLADLPADLGLNDTGFLFHDEQYEHSYRWDGTVWAFGPEDDHLAGTCCFSADGNIPRGGVWQVCDGSSVPVSHGDGTTANIVTPILSGDTFLMGGGLSAVRAASSPKWDLAAVTDDESAHTHPIGNIPEFVPGTGATVNLDTAPNTGPGTPHHHKLTDLNAVLMPPSIANHGLPQNIGLVFFMRQ